MFNSVLTMNEQAQINSWINGVTYEVNYWNRAITNKRRQRINASFADKKLLELPFLSSEKLKTAVTEANNIVLDIGCGMSYKNGSFIDENQSEMHYADPLAFFYNALSEKKGMKVPMIEFAFVEYLSCFYARNMFSAIIIENALDHSFDPVRGIKECMNVLRPGGILYLNHRKNEAEYENYRGFHQNNIDIQDDCLTIWNKQYRENISDLLAGVATIDIIEDNESIIAIIAKSENADGFTFDSGDYGLLCKQLLYTISLFTKTNFALSYHINKLYQRFFFFISGMLSPAAKERIKSIIKNIRNTRRRTQAG